MSSSSVESVWIPNYSRPAGLRLGDIPRKSRECTHRLRQSTSMPYRLPLLTVSRSSKNRTIAERMYVAAASAGLSFDDDVVQERCFLVNPFSSQFTTSLSQSRRLSPKRYKNDISYLDNPVDPLTYLKPVKPAKSDSVESKRVVGSRTASEAGPADLSVARGDSGDVSLQWRKTSSNSDVPTGEENNAVEWDECLVMKLSANTARWLAENAATREDSRRLHHILDTVHGPADDQVELVEVKHSDTDAAAAKTLEKPWISGKDM